MPKSIHTPHACIIGFTKGAQVEPMLQVYRAMLPHPGKRRLGIGVAMNWKLLNDEPTTLSRTSPRPDDIRDVFTDMHPVKNCLFYSDDEEPQPGEDHDLESNLQLALTFCGPHLHLLNLDLGQLPDPAKIVKGIIGARKDLEVVLNIKKEVADGTSPEEVTEMLAPYDGVITGFALDIDTLKLFDVTFAIIERYPKLGISLGGSGLNTGSVKHLGSVFSLLKGVSVDANIGIRTKRNKHSPIDWTEAGAFLANLHYALK